MTIAEHIQHGAWTARCLSWVVRLQQRHDGWEATLWHWPLNKARTKVATKDGFDCAKEAVKWVAELLSNEGISVLLNDGKRTRTLVDTLAFTPAPQLVLGHEVHA
jgi:hypothetical protein